MALTFQESLRLKQKLKLTPGELGFVVAVLDHKVVARGLAIEYASFAGKSPLGEMTLNSYRVMLCRLNQKLPATIRICCSNSRGEISQNRAVKSTHHCLSSDWAHEELLRIARGQQAELAA